MRFFGREEELESLPFFHLHGVPIDSVAPYVKRGGKKGEGVQVDLMIQTRRSVYLVEVKRNDEIGEEVVRGNAFFDALVSSRNLLGLGGRGGV